MNANATVMGSEDKSNRELERDLVARAREGDGDAFASLFHLHSRRVYSLCLRMTGDVSEAEDLTQEAFLQVFRKLSAFRGESAFSTWLYRIAVNTVLMKVRRRSLRQVSLDEPQNAGFSSVPREYGRDDPRLLSAPDRMTLVQAIRQLPKGCRKIFILHHIDGYEHGEIARLLRCSTGNSKSQLHKAKSKLRALLFGGNGREEKHSGKGLRGESGKDLRALAAAPLPNPETNLQAAAASACGEP